MSLRGRCTPAWPSPLISANIILSPLYISRAPMTSRDPVGDQGIAAQKNAKAAVKSADPAAPLQAAE